MLTTINKKNQIGLGTKVSWEPRWRKFASNAGGARERSSRLVIEIGARSSWIASLFPVPRFLKKVSAIFWLRTQSRYPKNLQNSPVLGFLCPQCPQSNFSKRLKVVEVRTRTFSPVPRNFG